MAHVLKILLWQNCCNSFSGYLLNFSQETGMKETKRLKYLFTPNKQYITMLVLTNLRRISGALIKLNLYCMATYSINYP